MNRLFFATTFGILAMVTLLLFALPTPTSTEGGQSTDSGASADVLLIKNVYVTDQEGKREAASMLMKGGLIEAIAPELDVPEGATVIDGSTLTAMPGLLDSHTHSYGTALEDALRFGVTANIDMNTPASSLPEARAERVKLGPTTKADLFSSGTLATVEGGHGTQFGFPIETLASPDDALAWVQARKQEGSDFIKLVYMPYQSYFPSLDRATAKALIEAAHAEGLMALAHISTQRAAMDVVEDGIDGLVHVFADEKVSPEFIQAALEKNLFVIPTLVVIASVAGEEDPLVELDEVRQWLSPMQEQTLANRFMSKPPGFAMDIALANVRQLHSAGVRILAGSDAPNPGTAYGYSLHREMELLVRAGLSHAETLRAATELPAQLFGLTDRGVLEEGKRADVLLVRGNPYASVRSSRQIAYVIKNGRVVERAAVEAAAAPLIADALLGSFEEGLDGPGALSWSATDDSMMGGQSAAQIQRVARGDGGFALAVKAEQKAGFPWPWAGVGLGSSASGAIADVSKYSTIAVDIKGTPGTYRLMMFSGAGAGEPPTRNFEVTTEWQTVRLSLEQFTGFDESAFSMLSIVAGAGPGVVEFVVDEVRFEE